MYPDGRTSLLQDQLVEILLLPVRNVQQDAGIAYRLFLPGTVDVHRATREMVRVGCTSTGDLKPLLITIGLSCDTQGLSPL